jgi:hypothetical protein
LMDPALVVTTGPTVIKAGESVETLLTFEPTNPTGRGFREQRTRKELRDAPSV